jgi:hypothetical protein
VVRCFISWPTVSYPPTGRTHEDAQFLSNTACLCPGTKLILPEYAFGGLQLVPMLIYVVLNLSTVLVINNDFKKPMDLNLESIVAIYCRLVALI